VTDDPDNMLAMPVAFRADRAEGWNPVARRSHRGHHATSKRGRAAAAARARHGSAKKSSAKSSSAKAGKAKSGGTKHVAAGKRISHASKASAAKSAPKSTPKKRARR
jgi:hypothetical protein